MTAKAGGFDLASTLVPHGVDEQHRPPMVIGAVGTGPHSPLVAATTVRLAKGHGADAILVTMSASQEDDAAAAEVLEELAAHAPGADTRLIRADSPGQLLDSLPSDGLVVLGAPGGSWWQRQFFGQGRKLIHAAPAGSVVVRAADRRCFHSLEELTPLGPLMRAADALAVMTFAVVPVVVDGRVVGQVRRSVVEDAPPDMPVGDLVETAIVAHADEPTAALGNLAESLEGSPVPVVDDDARLLGGVVSGP